MTKIALWLIAPLVMVVLTAAKWLWLATRWVGRMTWLACRAVGVVIVGVVRRVGNRTNLPKR